MIKRGASFERGGRAQLVAVAVNVAHVPVVNHVP